MYKFTIFKGGQTFQISDYGENKIDRICHIQFFIRGTKLELVCKK